MSTTYHKFYRKVLNIENFTVEIADETIKGKRVLWCTVEELTSRTVKTGHIGFSVYLGSRENRGTEARISRKPVSIKLNKPLSSKFFGDINLDRIWGKAMHHAGKEFILNTPKYSKNLTGTVSWFSDVQGAITCDLTGYTYMVHACNIKGAKTWYPETACVYLKKGDKVTFDVCDLGYLSAKVTGGAIYFDREKWDKLDHSRLAFKCDENGKAINGLFDDNN